MTSMNPEKEFSFFRQLTAYSGIGSDFNERRWNKMTKGEQTKKRLLETAIQLFYEHGYQKTTMRMISAETGIGIGNIYYYFKGKEEFINEVNRRSFKEIVAYYNTYHQHDKNGYVNFITLRYALLQYIMGDERSIALYRDLYHMPQIRTLLAEGNRDMMIEIFEEEHLPVYENDLDIASCIVSTTEFDLINLSLSNPGRFDNDYLFKQPYRYMLMFFGLTPEESDVIIEKSIIKGEKLSKKLLANLNLFRTLEN